MRNLSLRRRLCLRSKTHRSWTAKECFIIYRHLNITTNASHCIEGEIKEYATTLRAEFLSLIQVSHNPGLHDPPAPGKEWTKLRQNRNFILFQFASMCHKIKKILKPIEFNFMFALQAITISLFSTPASLLCVFSSIKSFNQKFGKNYFCTGIVLL